MNKKDEMEKSWNKSEWSGPYKMNKSERVFHDGFEAAWDLVMNERRGIIEQAANIAVEKMKKLRFELGDRVKYRFAAGGTRKGRIVGIKDDDDITVLWDTDSTVYGPYNIKELIKLKPKPREFWVNTYLRATYTTQIVFDTKEKADKYSTEKRAECIHVQEVREKK